MKKIYFFLLLLAITATANAQMWQYQWAKKYTSVSNPAPREMIRHNDHLIITGETGTPGLFVMMVDTMGNTMWSQTFDMSSSQGLIAVKSVVADNNAIYVAGYFVQAALQVGTTTLTTSPYWDGFIIKLDMSGNPVWAQQYGGAGDDYMLDLVMHNGMINVLGSFEGTATFGSNTVTAASAHNMIIGTLDVTDGDLSTYMVKDADMRGSGRLRFTSTGEYVILGDFQQQVNVDTVSEYYGGPYPTPFLMKLNAAGTGLWAKELSGFGDASGEELELDATDAIYADIYGGWTSGVQSDFNRYADNNSTPVWSYTIPATGDYGTGSYIGDIETSGNRLFIAAKSNNSNSYGDPNDDTTMLRIAEFTSSGSIAWEDSSVWQALGNNLDAAAIALGIGNNMFVAGSFSETVSFDTTMLSSPGTKAIFVAKLGEPTITGIAGTGTRNIFNIYPNPSNGSFMLEGNAAGEVQLLIRNIQGQLVYANHLSLSPGVINTIHTGDLSNGIYMIELVNGSNTSRQKLVIANK